MCRSPTERGHPPRGDQNAQERVGSESSNRRRELSSLFLPPHGTSGRWRGKKARMSADQQPIGGTQSAAITKAVVGIFRDYTGRGPTKARTFVNEDMINVLLADTMTTAERNLATDGEQDFVLDIRRKFQRTMEEDLTAAVEEHTGRRVVAFMSDNSIEPDLALESFVLA
jgi:uncharacterized protein YbcI